VSGPRPLGDLVRLFLRLGFAGFGGPLVHIAMMETEVVERRRWLTKQEFLDGLALCQMLPGPASTQLGVLICHTRGGLPGALLGGAAFILPGFCVMLLFTLLYERWGSLPALGPVFTGIAPAVVAVILFSAWRLGRSAVTRIDLALLCAVGFILTAKLHLDTALTLILCGATAAALRRLAARTSTARAWTVPALMTAAPEVYARLAWLWIKMGALVYGGGYVIIPVVRGEAVGRFGWMSDRVFLDGLRLRRSARHAGSQDQAAGHRPIDDVPQYGREFLPVLPRSDTREARTGVPCLSNSARGPRQRLHRGAEP